MTSEQPIHRIAITLPSEVGNSITKVVAQIRAAENPRDHAPELSRVIRLATGAGLRQCFLRPLEIADSGFLVRKPAELAISSAERTLMLLAEQLISRMSRKQVRAIADFLDELHLRPSNQRIE